MPKVVSITGSCGYANHEQVREFVRSLAKGTIVISGGAPGVDTIAVLEAKACGLPFEVYHAKWRVQGMYNKFAGHERNAVLVERGQTFAIFWDGRSPGTGNMIDQVLAACKPLLINPRGPRGAVSSPSLVPRTSGTQKCP